MKRVRKKLTTHAVPFLSVFSAFSFVLMMFNLPLPGGTTGHAVGVGIASIVLGPWMAILAISMALLVQAVFFGDGGISSYGANCFNMAIAGSLVAYGVYQVGSFRSGLSSARRIFVAGFAGYAAINVAALLAAVEFGIQPLFFHDSNGTPLYAPYPLNVSVPAMMIGHLTFAGLAEFLVTAGMLKYLVHLDPALLAITSGSFYSPSRASRRKIWLAVGVAICLTPLGILAAGKAWGEWSLDDFASSAGRKAIAAASGNTAVPAQAPKGLKSMSDLWQAPLADYELSALRNSSAAYFICAALGVGAVIGFASLISFLQRRGETGENFTQPPPTQAKGTSRRTTFIEKTIGGLLHGMQEALVAEEFARSKGFLQRLDPRVKLLGLTFLIVASVAVHRLTALLALFVLGILFAAFSRVSPSLLLKRIWLPVLAFTGVIALPALFTVPGDVLGRVPLLGWTVTLPGLISAALLVFRAESAGTFSLLLVLCTPWNQLLRALRFCRVPVTAIVILQMTHRYLFLLLETAQSMLEARRARLVGFLHGSEQRRLLTATAGVLLDKTLYLGREVHSAMLARGFRGEVYLLNDPEIRVRDKAWLSGFFALAAILCWLGR